tara:strand:+ start:491 stop:784 length:294 start_codon:yes stop_codon:yes gene_type:complete
MKLSQYSDYEKYILVAENSKVLSGGYQGFVNLKEVLQIIRTMFSKQTTTYEYNNNFYTSKITISDMGTILNSFDMGKHRRGFDLVKSIGNQIGIGKI